MSQFKTLLLLTIIVCAQLSFAEGGCTEAHDIAEQLCSPPEQNLLGPADSREDSSETAQSAANKISNLHAQCLKAHNACQIICKAEVDELEKMKLYAEIRTLEPMVYGCSKTGPIAMESTQLYVAKVEAERQAKAAAYISSKATSKEMLSNASFETGMTSLPMLPFGGTR